jgi:hypothetical protein
MKATSLPDTFSDYNPGMQLNHCGTKQLWEGHVELGHIKKIMVIVPFLWKVGMVGEASFCFFIFEGERQRMN